MQRWLNISLFLALAGIFSLPAAGQVNWSSTTAVPDNYLQFFWLDKADSTLYVGGYSIVTINGQPSRWGFIYRKGIVAQLPFADSLKGNPVAMERFNGKLYISDGDCFGSYDLANGWKTIVPPKPGGGNGIYCIYKYGNQLLLGGQFKNLSGSNATTLALFDGNTFANFHRADTIIPYDWAVGAIAEYKGNVVVAGNIDRPNGIKEIAQWDGQRWKDVGGGIGGGGMEGVSRLVVIKDDLYVAGLFKESSGCPGNNVARWDGANWHRMGAGIQPNSAVYDMIAVGDTLVMVGPFNKADGQPSYRYARYYNGRWCPNTDSFDNGLNCVINYYDTLMVGGAFHHVGTQPVDYIARVVSQSDCLSFLGMGAGSKVPAALQVSAAPNPASGEVTLTISAAAPATVQLRLYDPLGRVLLRRPVRVQPGRHPVPLSLTGLPSGLYYISVGDGQNKAYARMMKL